jgi:hypothetical protein
MKRFVVMSAVGTAALLLAIGATTAANAQTQHNSTMNTSECVSVPYVPGDCSGFTATAGTTVQMQCWNTGPQAMGQGKWFEITVLSGPRYGLTGEVPAPSVSNQWTSSPHC